ncbi:hypothetical protein LY11_04168 [Pedobacter cryoconitis]|uniref:Uncharacterized protein n=1 Tax=Pedobacter cryoconitis TaxID=188932 RepID=A0A327S7U0_9SPHI|nr:hypothetical protein LY11_04168 [Pedobacter cryoconitis]
MSLIITILPLFIFIILAIIGQRLLKFKGYEGYYNFLLILSITPLFWLIAGCLTSKNTKNNTGLASVLSIIFAIFLLGVSVYMKGQSRGI